MISIKRISTLLLVIPMLALTACQERERTDVDGFAADTTMQQLEGFRSDLRAELQQIDQDLSQLEQELAQATDTASMNMETSIADLRRERQEIEQDLMELGQDAERDWVSMRGDLQGRVDELAVDVGRARMKAAATVEEFQSIAQQKLNEIDNKMSGFLAMDGTTTGMRTPETGMTDRTTPQAPERDMTDERLGEGADIAQDQPLPDADGRLGTGETATGVDAEVQEWQEERQQLAQDVQQLNASAEDSFEERKDELADAIADLNAEVRQAVSRMDERSDFVHTGY